MSEDNKRIALVTGASRGIGRAVALLLAQQGWHVIAAARSQKALEALDDEAQTAGAEALTLVPLDLKDFDGIDRLGAALYERFGKLDALAACAGVLGALTPSFQAAPRVIEETLNVNFVANYRLLRAMHPLLRASNAGRSVYITTGNAADPRAYWGPYGASKAALESYVRAYAKEIEITPMRVNLFSPGATRTAMRAKAMPGEDPETLKTPEDVAPEIVAMLQPSFEENGALVRAKEKQASA